MTNLYKQRKLNLNLNQQSSSRTAHMCVRISLCTTDNTAQNSYENLPSYSPGNHHCSDVDYPLNDQKSLIILPMHRAYLEHTQQHKVPGLHVPRQPEPCHTQIICQHTWQHQTTEYYSIFLLTWTDNFEAQTVRQFGNDRQNYKPYNFLFVFNLPPSYKKKPFNGPLSRTTRARQY